MVNGTNAKFDIGACLNTVEALREAFPHAGIPLILNLEQCHRYCGKGIGPYPFWTVVDALTTWVFPLFNLLGHIAFTPTTLYGVRWYSGWGYGNFFAVATHVLADPIDSIWNLATKLGAGRRIRRRCDELDLSWLGIPLHEENSVKNDIAKVLFALEDFGADKLRTGWSAISALSSSDSGKKNVQRAKKALWKIKHASHELAFTRVNDSLSSFLAIVLYGVAVFGSLIRIKSETTITYHEPHTIAVRELFYWLLLVIILGSATGRWPSQWTPWNILTRLGKKLVRCEGFDLGEIEPWNGGNYVWRWENNIFDMHDSICTALCCPIRDTTFSTTGRNRHPISAKMQSNSQRVVLLAISLLSLTVSWAVSFAISWRTPTPGLGGRGIWELCFLATWVLNFVHTQWWRTRAPRSGMRKVFTGVWIKDSILSFCVLFVQLAAFQGT
ncbi:hypothetical protein MMC20_003129 [Loxospora ochrophaea]|nr:hypothetical protein [Loxospora ochrophaea]